ncbi:hypothetical protein M378DRAFT_154841 [Amanita muscaria Koide BX008]|uniref:Uncharacterized protein n=1 Tax=Amanita muscaria (strain Koide BX008) TaxID=946122 RepID=A0A0C2XNW3_AMAMK|nr:hypothetical protein M378DRAFT_154841 [Amanita muscaria Koide BX008]
MFIGTVLTAQRSALGSINHPKNKISVRSGRFVYRIWKEHRVKEHIPPECTIPEAMFRRCLRQTD